MTATLLFLTEHLPWLRLEEGGIRARGGGLADLAGTPVVAAAPAAALTLFRVSLPDLAPPQARAAARLIVAGRSAAPIDTLHVAVGDADQDGMRWVCAVSVATMADWLRALSDGGVEVQTLVPSPLLLASQSTRLGRGDPGGGETVVRGPDMGFVDDPVLTPILAEGAPIVDLPAEAIEAGLIDAVHTPPLTLLQGAFEPKRRWQPDARSQRRLSALAAVLALVTLAIPVVHLVRVNRDSRTLEDKARAIETEALGGTSAEARLAGLRGPGAGLGTTFRAVRAAVQATPNSEISSAAFGQDGLLTVSATASSASELEALRAHIVAAGFEATPGVASGGSRPGIVLGVRGR